MLAFEYIPGNLRIPGTRIEVQPGGTNNAGNNAKGLLIGQLLATGSKVTTVATSAASASGTSLTFASATVIQNVVPGPFLLAIDRTTPAAIPAGTYVVSKASGTVTLSAAVTSVGNADSIQFVDTTPIWLNSQINAVALFGAGSMLARMDAKRRLNDPFGEWWVMPLPDDPAAVAASGSVSFAGIVTATGVLALYVAGVPVPVVCTSSMTAAQVATAVAAAINANTSLPVTASATSGVVTATAKNAGAAGNDIDLRVNYYGPQNNEFTPAGIVVTIAPMASGATNPYAAMTAAFLTLPPQVWGAVVCPYNDTNSLNALQTFMGDVSGLWSWAQMKYGIAFCAMQGALGANETFLAARNDPHTSIMPFTKAATPPPEWAAALGAAYLALQRSQPGANSNGLAIQGVLPPASGDRYQDSDDNALLWSGGSTFYVDSGGGVHVQKLITTWQTNPITGAPDATFLQVDDMYRIAFALSYMKGQIDAYSQGARISPDGTRFGPGIKVITPAIMFAFIVGLYNYLIGLAIVTNVAAFQAGLVVIIDPQNDKRLDIQWPGIIVGDLDIVAILAQPVT